ncbi:MAG: MBL fold metallo-hydrolase [Sphingomonadales bacterium]|nr:MBL fold metallo-hydrolase [Sphingomonadales bacterium]MDE2568266.1 MBL fold metallo-hydrolase [Sphingomonadales bacterium]
MLKSATIALALLAGNVSTRAIAADEAAPSHAASIVLLGTKGGPTADPERSEPANLLVVDGHTYLIDAGAGVARQLAAAGHAPPTIHTIFLTHHHLDHTAGLESLIGLNWIGNGLFGRHDPVDIYGPPATDHLVAAALDYLSTSQRIFRAGIPSLPDSRTMYRAHVIDANGQFFDDGTVKVTAVENSHFSHPSFGPDGMQDMSFSYRFDTPEGSVVFTGDTGPSDAVAELAKGADVLVSEVYLSTPESPEDKASAGDALRKELAEHMAREHLSPAEVGKIAARAGVKTVILTHIVAAPSDDLEKTLEAGVHKYFSGPVIVGHDLLTFDLGKPAAK